jgi:hypothetical protein
VNLSLNLRLLPNLVFLLLAVAFPVVAQDGNGGASFPFSPAPYKVGEHLTYDVSFSNFVSAAHVEVQVVSRGQFQGREAIQLRAHAETAGVVNVALFSLNNDYTTYGKYDFVSAFYRVRALPLTMGAVYNFNIYGESQNLQAEFRVTGNQVVKTAVGSFNSIVTQVRIAGSSRFKNVKAYFSDDDRHIPVLITARVSTGDIKIELAGSEIIKAKSNMAADPDATPTPTPTPTPRPTPRPIPAPTPITTANADWPFPIGEQLNYQVYLGNTAAPLGLATFHVKSRSRYFDRDGLYLSVTAQTTGAAARVFIANDTIETYVDPQSLLPYRVVMNRVEGKNRINQTLTLDQNRGSATAERNQRIDIPIGTHDYLSLFYVVRTFQTVPTKRNAIPLLVEGKTKTLFITALKRETIEIGNQKIKSIALSLTTDDPQSDKFQLRAWISDDRRRLPLRLTCQTELGQLRADLAIVPASPQ